MRVVQVLTLVSSVGEYGGPQAVAESQTRALRSMGHDVTIVAGRRPNDRDAPSGMDSPAETFPVRSMLPRGHVSGLVGLRVLWGMAACILKSDVVHIHLARDVIPLAAAWSALTFRRPYLVQTHGMITTDGRLPIRLIDALFVRPVLRRAKARLVLSEVERVHIGRVMRQRATFVLVPNAAPPASQLKARQGQREALFLARLHPRKRVLDFARAAEASIGDGVAYRVVGPDGGGLSGLRAFLNERPTAPVMYEGAVAPDSARARMADSGVFVLPSKNEPFPMAVLEALSVGLPCVVTASCAIADQLERSGAALVVPDGRPDLIAVAVAEILDEPELWRHMSSSALALCAGQLSEAVLAETLDRLVRACAADGLADDSSCRDADRPVCADL